MDANKTALVRMMGFSKPTVTTRKGRPSERRSILIGTPSLVVISKPKRKAKVLDSKTEKASQNLDRSRRIDMKRDTKVRCIERYPRVMMAMSIVSACY
jgi:hypothetical protein